MGIFKNITGFDINYFIATSMYSKDAFDIQLTEDITDPTLQKAVKLSRFIRSCYPELINGKYKNVANFTQEIKGIN